MNEPRIALNEFVVVAREYVAWCESPSEGESEDARRVLGLLVRLYSLALQLGLPEAEDIEDEARSPDDAAWRKVFERGGKLPFTFYSEVFDPMVLPPEKPGIGDLADDIADLHRDLAEGLSLINAGHDAAAEWFFTFSFRSHWGRHASSAIRALHCWFARTGRW